MCLWNNETITVTIDYIRQENSNASQLSRPTHAAERLANLFQIEF